MEIAARGKFCRGTISRWGGGVRGSGRIGGCGVIRGRCGSGLGRKDVARRLLMAGRPVLRIPVICCCCATFSWSSKTLVCGCAVGCSSVRERKGVGSRVERRKEFGLSSCSGARLVARLDLLVRGLFKQLVVS